MRQPSLFLPLFLIIVGALWFLRSMHWFPDTAVIIAFALMVAGILVLLLDGINKQSVVSGPLLLYIGGAIYASHEYDHNTSVILALGMMVLGILLLIARSNAVPHKRARHLPPTERD